jgi:hypothetical protein
MSGANAASDLQVYVDQPNVEDTISILRGLRERYEVHHGVRITDSALVEAAVLSDRYISERFLPDKAIDLVDEAAAKLKMEITSKPEKLDEIDRNVRFNHQPRPRERCCPLPTRATYPCSRGAVENGAKESLSHQTLRGGGRWGHP